MAKVDIELYSTDWFLASGGVVASIEKRKWPFDVAQLVNQEVIIDNKRFMVTGVERWAMMWRTEADWTIGLRVEPLDDSVSHRLWKSTNGPTLYEDLEIPA